MQELSLAHIHAPTVSVREQAALVVGRLRRQGTMTFRALSATPRTLLTTVARFLALLELFREGAVSFDQMTPMGELTVRWTGAEDGEVDITDEFDGACRSLSSRPVAEPVETDSRRPGGARVVTDTLDIPLADLRPALEAVLMVADQPLDHLTLADRGRLPGRPGRRGA